jgi:hypothetical protein
MFTGMVRDLDESFELLKTGVRLNSKRILRRQDVGCHSEESVSTL